jgi:glyoxalase family protein
LQLIDPHGLKLALVESESSLGRPFTVWDESPIPAEHQIRGLEGARMSEASLPMTISFLEKTMGFREIGLENGWIRAEWERENLGSMSMCESYLARAAAHGEPAAFTIWRGAWMTMRTRLKSGARSRAVARIRRR